MRFMMLVKASKDSEAGVLPTKELLTAMGQFNEEMIKAGVLLSGDGLHPSSKGVRITFSGAKRTVTDGPFAETKELLAGFWLIQAQSKDEAIAWASRVPFADGETIDPRRAPRGPPVGRLSPAYPLIHRRPHHPNSHALTRFCGPSPKI